MSFREKTAWAMGAILIIFGVHYFQRVIGTSLHLGEVAAPNMKYIIFYVVAIIIASIIANILVASASPDEAEEPADEREKTIQDRAGHWSGYVLAVGAVAALFHYSFRPDGNLMFHIVFASLLLSQIAEYGFQIFFFRRGV